MRTLRLGDTGEDVKTLQRLIVTLITGKFSNIDEIVVREFQEKNGLDVDGIVGRDTWTALLTKDDPKPVEPVKPLDPDKPSILKKQDWPSQSGCDSFYGNPRGSSGKASSKWENANLVKVIPPWKMVDEDSKRPISGITIHKKCRDSLERVLHAAWMHYGQSQSEIEKHNLHLFSGSYVFRNIRGSNRLSMHAYGIALDIAAGLNDLGEPYDPKHGIPMDVVKMFEAEGWTWGGRWKSRPDAMHFQAADV